MCQRPRVSKAHRRNCPRGGEWQHPKGRWCRSQRCWRSYHACCRRGTSSLWVWRASQPCARALFCPGQIVPDKLPTHPTGRDHPLQQNECIHQPFTTHVWFRPQSLLNTNYVDKYKRGCAPCHTRVGFPVCPHETQHDNGDNGRARPRGVDPATFGLAGCRRGLRRQGRGLARRLVAWVADCPAGLSCRPTHLVQAGHCQRAEP